MAVYTWRGDAQRLAGIIKIGFTGTHAIDDVLSFTINGKSVEITLGATVTDAAIAAACVLLLGGSSTAPSAGYSMAPPTTAEAGAEFSELSWTNIDPLDSEAVAGDFLYATGDAVEIGRPFTLTYTSDDVGTFSTAVHQIDTSPNHWIAENFDEDGSPTTTWPITGSDTVIVRDSSVSVLYNLEDGADSAVLNIFQSFTGDIGLPEFNPTGYYEYRTRFLDHGATLCNIGMGEGGGSSRIMIDANATATTWDIFNSGSAPSDEESAITLVGGAVTSDIYARGNASIDLGREVATAANFNLVEMTGNAFLRIGTSATETTTVINVQDNATLDIEGSHTNADVNLYGNSRLITRGSLIGIVVHQGNSWTNFGTCTTQDMTLFPGVTLDLESSTGALTATVSTLHAPMTINDRSDRLVLSAAATVYGGLQNINWNTADSVSVNVT